MKTTEPSLRALAAILDAERVRVGDTPPAQMVAVLGFGLVPTLARIVRAGTLDSEAGRLAAGGLLMMAVDFAHHAGIGPGDIGRAAVHAWDVGGENAERARRGEL